MELSGQQRKQLQSALIDAFPTTASLEQMLAFGLDKNLRAIAGEGSLQDIVFKLIQAANAEGWVEGLVRVACDSNSGNPRLRIIAEGLLPNDDPKVSSPNIPQKQSVQSQYKTNAQQQFDVFLAHNSLDKPQVSKIAEELKHRGLKPWLDEEQIPPGRSFQDEIQQAIPLVKSAAIFLGLQGLGNWQSWELRAFISSCVKNNIPVIPVLLPGVSSLPEHLLFLQEFRWVEFAQEIDDASALDLLEWGITGRKPETTVEYRKKPGQIPEALDSKKYDVFLCYNNEDQQEVEQIGEYLKEQKIQPWLDLWENSAGTSNQQLPIENIGAIAVFIGRNGGPWFDKDIESLIWGFIKLERLVIPVFLKNAPRNLKLPVYLQHLKDVDFGKQDSSSMTDLLLYITRKEQQQEASWDG